jgi:hypothetical protein
MSTYEADCVVSATEPLMVTKIVPNTGARSNFLRLPGSSQNDWAWRARRPNRITFTSRVLPGKLRSVELTLVILRPQRVRPET